MWFCHRPLETLETFKTIIRPRRTRGRKNKNQCVCDAPSEYVYRIQFLNPVNGSYAHLPNVAKETSGKFVSPGW
jgi:hypothetical protein